MVVYKSMWTIRSLSALGEQVRKNSSLVWSWERHIYSMSWTRRVRWSPSLSRFTTFWIWSFSSRRLAVIPRLKSLSYYLPIAVGRIVKFIPFQKELEGWEMQTASSRFWTRIAKSISFNDNYNATRKVVIKPNSSSSSYYYFTPCEFFYN